MSVSIVHTLHTFDWPTALGRVKPALEAAAEAHDEDDRFVQSNMDRLKAEGLFAAGVPAELGGGGLGPQALGAMLREIGQACGSTALALSMHTHLVAALAWRWRRDPQATEKILRRIVEEKLTLVSSGGSDWLDGSGTARRVEGGYEVSGRKVFASGVPGGDLMMTMAVEQTDEGPMVLHVPVPLRGPGVEIIETWRTLGMRGTGSHDVSFEGVFVPEAAVSVRRPAGRWHPSMHLVAKIAIPLIYAVYLGVAEGARDLALRLAAKGKSKPETISSVGEMETHLAGCRLAVADMLEAAEEAEPGPETSNRVMTGRTLAARAAIATVEKAMEAAGGAGFFRRSGLERRFRDIQAARYHPLQEKAQASFAGRVALGISIDPEG